MDSYLSIKTVAALLSVSQAGVRRWLREGKLKGVRAGRLIRIPHTALQDFLSAKHEEQGKDV